MDEVCKTESKINTKAILSILVFSAFIGVFNETI